MVYRPHNHAFYTPLIISRNLKKTVSKIFLLRESRPIFQKNFDQKMRFSRKINEILYKWANMKKMLHKIRNKFEKWKCWTSQVISRHNFCWRFRFCQSKNEKVSFSEFFRALKSKNVGQKWKTAGSSIFGQRFFKK